MRDSPLYTLAFAAAVCVVCAVTVASASVWLRDAQAQNRALDRQKKVLAVAGLLPERRRHSAELIGALFERRVHPRRVALSTGRWLSEAEPARPEARREAPPNAAGLLHLPQARTVYVIRDEAGEPEALVLPIEGKGLWSTMRGFLALELADLNTVRGIEFYEHGETPGLGGEVDNPAWKASWRGRRAFDSAGRPALRVARRDVGPPAQAPHEVDALTGATLTARGVTSLVQFWLGPDGYGPLLERLRAERGV